MVEEQIVTNVVENLANEQYLGAEMVRDSAAEVTESSLKLKK